jgi:hypothetical protein
MKNIYDNLLQSIYIFTYTFIGIITYIYSEYIYMYVLYIKNNYLHNSYILFLKKNTFSERLDPSDLYLKNIHGYTIVWN